MGDTVITGVRDIELLYDDATPANQNPVSTGLVAIEPGGAVALAAALFHSGDVSGESVIAVASGGNVDDEMLRQALSVEI